MHMLDSMRLAVDWLNLQQSTFLEVFMLTGSVHICTWSLLK